MKRKNFLDVFWHPNARKLLAFSHHARKILAFSMIELMISLITISLIAAAMTPVITKKAKLQVSAGSGLGQRCMEKFGEFCKVCTNSKCILCTISCSDGYRKDSEQCKCEGCSDENCLRCNEDDTCSRCKEGYYINGGACSLCDVGNYCPDGKNQKPCKPGEYCNTQGLIEPNDCEIGYYCPDGKTRTQCVQGTYCSSKGLDKASDCDIGYYCPDGKYQKPCTPGTYCDVAGLKNPKNCDAGYYCPNGKDKIKCPAGTKSASGAAICTDCPLGEYTTNHTSCSSCTGNTIVNSSKTACTSCSAGTTPNDSHTSCVNVSCSTITPHCLTCPEGVCTGCETGYYLDGTTCKPCSDKFGSTCAACTKTECTSYSCPSGQFWDSTGKYTNGTPSCYTCGPFHGPGTCLECTEDGCTKCKEGEKLIGQYCAGCGGLFGPKCTECTDTACTKCEGGYISSTGYCTPCKSGCKRCDETRCLECEAYHTNSAKNDGSCEISSCPSGTTKHQNTSNGKIVCAQDLPGGNTLPGVEIIPGDGVYQDGACTYISGTPHKCCYRDELVTPYIEDSVYKSKSIYIYSCNYNVAKEYCQTLSTGGLTWRLPDDKELYGLTINICERFPFTTPPTQPYCLEGGWRIWVNGGRAYPYCAIAPYTYALCSVLNIDYGSDTNNYGQIRCVAD